MIKIKHVVYKVAGSIQTELQRFDHADSAMQWLLDALTKYAEVNESERVLRRMSDDLGKRERQQGSKPTDDDYTFFVDKTEAHEKLSTEFIAEFGAFEPSHEDEFQIIKTFIYRAHD